MSVVLWGPQGAGKSWLLASFPRELETCNQQYPEFRYELHELRPDGTDTAPLEVTPPPAHTGHIREYKWVFRRCPLVDDRAHRISAHTHAMQVTLLPDQEGVAGLYAPAEHEAAHAILSRAEAVVAVLDPCRLESFQADATAGVHAESLLDKSVWSQEEYLRTVHALLELLGRKGSPTQTVSVCISKMDRIGLVDGTLNIVEKLFGRQMVQMLEYYRRRLAVEVFPVTVFDGPPPAGSGPDAWDENQWERWRPHNAAAPFFHLFQEKEKAVFKQRPLDALLFQRWKTRNYLPYPMEARSANAGGKEQE
jgi:hypothetical protein